MAASKLLLMKLSTKGWVVPEEVGRLVMSLSNLAFF